MSRFLEKMRRGVVPTDSDMYTHIHATTRYNSDHAAEALASLRIDSTPLTSPNYLLEGLALNGKYVLDLGCGSGVLAKKCAQLVGPHGRVYGIDSAVGEIAIARASITQPNVTFLCEPAQSISLKDQEVDIVMSHYGFLIFRPLLPVIQQIARILKPNGLFITNIHNAISPDGVTKALWDLAIAYEKQVPNFSNMGWGDLGKKSAPDIARLFETYRQVSDVRETAYTAILEGPPTTALQHIQDLLQIGYFLSTDDYANYVRDLAAIFQQHQKNNRIQLKIPMTKIHLQLA